MRAKKQMQHPNYVVLSDQNQREDNEDSFLIAKFYPHGAKGPLTLLGIADGMGGHKYGEDVSREALRHTCLSLFEQLSVRSALNSLGTEEAFDVARLGTALLEAVEQTNAYVQRMILANKWGKAGSTIVVVAIYGDAARVVNLGDSPLFHYSVAEQTLKQVTIDHTVAGALMRAGLITPEMARIHEGSDRLEFFIGNEAMPRDAPVHEVSLSPGDLLLLCSDGISSALGLQQLQSVLGEANTASKDVLQLDILAEQLLDASTASGESDNQTLILWRHTAAGGLACDSPSR